MGRAEGPIQTTSIHLEIFEIQVQDQVFGCGRDGSAGYGLGARGRGRRPARGGRGALRVGSVVLGFAAAAGMLSLSGCSWAASGQRPAAPPAGEGAPAALSADPASGSSSVAVGGALSAGGVGEESAPAVAVGGSSSVATAGMPVPAVEAAAPSSTAPSVGGVAAGVSAASQPGDLGGHRHDDDGSGHHHHKHRHSRVSEPAPGEHHTSSGHSTMGDLHEHAPGQAQPHHDHPHHHLSEAEMMQLLVRQLLDHPSI